MQRVQQVGSLQASNGGRNCRLSSLHDCSQGVWLGRLQVINQDAQRQVAYRLEADLINNKGGLSRLEQRALSNIFGE